TTDGLFYTDDAMAIELWWYSLDVTAPYSEVLALQRRGDIVRIGNSLGVFQQNDEGGFSPLDKGLPPVVISSVFSVESDMYVSSNKGIRRFNSGANDWEYCVNFPGNSVEGIVRYNDTTYFVYNGTGVYVSYDTAKSWTLKRSQTGISDIAVVEGEAIFIGTDAGVIRSLNHGQTWVPANIGLDNLNVSKIRPVGNYIFAASDVIYRTDSN